MFADTYNERSALNISGKIPSSPSLRLTAEEQVELSRIMTDVKKYAEEITSQAIVGSISMEEFDKAVEKLKTMNIGRAIEIQQNAYNKLLAKRGNK